MPDIDVAITCGQLVDVRAQQIAADMLVLVSGGRVAQVVSARDYPQEKLPDTVIDLSDLTLLPGLVDAHVHFYASACDGWRERSIEPHQEKLIRGVADARRLVERGFTSVRCMGFRDSPYIRDAIHAGEIVGPRVVTPRCMILPTGGSADPYWLPLEWVEQHDYRCRLADGPDDVRRAVREQLRGGADFIKLMATGGLVTRGSGGGESVRYYSVPELVAAVDESHRRGVRVAVHAMGSGAVEEAVTAGADSIEHGGDISDRVLAMMANSQTVLVPTLSINKVLSGRSASPSAEASTTASRADEALRLTIDTVARARSEGVRIAAGTDFGGLPVDRHGDNVLEMELLVEAGLTPGEALAAGTVTGGACMGRPGAVGSIEVGADADMIACAGNPLHDISVLRSVQFVMRSGKVVVPPAGPGSASV